VGCAQELDGGGIARSPRARDDPAATGTDAALVEHPWQGDSERLGRQTCHLGINVQPDQLVLFGTGREPDVALIRRPPQARKIALPYQGGDVSDGTAILERNHPGFRQPAGGWGKGELRPETQSALDYGMLTQDLGHSQLAAHASTVVTVTRECFTCGDKYPQDASPEMPAKEPDPIPEPEVFSDPGSAEQDAPSGDDGAAGTGQ
jgi:hypothetical protein